MKSKTLSRAVLAALAAACLLVPFLTSAVVPTYNEAYDMCSRTHEGGDVYECTKIYCEIFECIDDPEPTG